MLGLRSCLHSCRCSRRHKCTLTLVRAFHWDVCAAPLTVCVAMTGEISLVGQVLPVGGLKEKILAAHRAGIKTIIAPEANRPDIEENVPESVKTGIRFVYVEDVREVLHEVFRGEAVAERWKDTLSPGP